MKEIKAIIQPAVLNQVLIALHSIKDLPGCTVSTVVAYGRIRENEGADAFLKSAEMSKLEVVVPSRLVKKVLDVIYKSARTGTKGDGKVFVVETVNVLSLQTGAQGEKALR